MSYSSDVLALGPVGFWRMSDVSGTTMADSSGHARDGTYTNSPTLGATSLLVGDADAACSFASASSQYATVTDDNALDSLAGFTIVALVKPTNLASIQMIAARDGTSSRAFQWRLSTAGKLEFVKIASPAATATSSSSLSAGTPAHVATVLNGTDVRNYINGVLDGTPAAASGAIWNSTKNLQVAHRLHSTTNVPTDFLNGVLDELIVFDYALTATQIANLYKSSRTLSLSDTTTPTDTLKKSLNRALSDTVTSSEALAKTVNRAAISDTSTSSDALVKSPNKAVSDTVTSSDAQMKAANHVITDSSTLSESLSSDLEAGGSALTHSVDDTTTSTEDLATAPNKGLADTTTPTDVLTAGIGRAVADGVTSSEQLAAHLTRALADTTALSDSVDPSGAEAHELADTTTSADSLARHLSVHLDDVTTSSDQLGKALRTHLGDTVPLTDTLVRSFAKHLADQVTSSDQVTSTRGLTLALDDTTTLGDALRFGPIAPAPGERTLLVPAELRALRVAAEYRALLVPAELRALRVAEEHRIRTIPAETRRLEATS